MKLIGMLDSPYVRRAAISMQLLGLRFEHQSLSVFRGFDEFSRVNPVVKAPTLVCDDGEVLMDSTLIIDLAESLAHPRTLMPAALPQRQRALRLIGLALAACEKSVQIVYEHWVRPPEKWHEPWVARITGQMLAAFDALEQELAREPLEAGTEGITQAGVTVAVTWQFVQQVRPELVPTQRFPRLADFSARCEALPAFTAAPHGEGTVQPDPAAARAAPSIYIPPGFAAVTPYFFVDHAERFIAFLIDGLGGREVLRSLRPDGKVANVQVRLQGSTVMVSEASLAYPAMCGSYYLYVADAPSTMRSALAHGATLEMAVADMPYGDRQGGVRDAHGNLWWISERTVHAPYSA
jgi:glutathione S-transferase/uncharacterized glyoxalase superfamily protein PhnB